MRLSDINNKTISGMLTDIELAKAEDNTSEKLAERAMGEVKKSCSPEMMKQRPGIIYTADDIPKPPTNPNTGDPYFKVDRIAWNGEWTAGEVRLIPNSEFGGDDGY